MQPNNVYNNVFVKHRLSFFMQFSLQSISYIYQKWYFFKLSKIHVELKLVGYTKMERIHVLIKRNIIESKIKDISTDWDSSAISWLYWDDKEMNKVSERIMLSHRSEQIYLTCIEPILECFGFSPYLVYFSFFLFDRTPSVLKMPGYFEVNQWNWW